MKLSITSWKNTLRALGYKVVRNPAAKTAKRRSKQKTQPLTFGALEPRQMLASMPQLGPLQDQLVEEGQSFTVTATYSDADSGDTHSATIDWGDGHVQSLDAAFGEIEATHVYDDNGTFNPVLTLTDSDGLSDQSGFEVEVENVAPSGGDWGMQSFDRFSSFHYYSWHHHYYGGTLVEGSELSLWASFYDPSLSDEFSARLYVDGVLQEDVDIEPSVYRQPNRTYISLKYNYVIPDGGQQSLTLELTDDDGATASRTFQIDALEHNPIVTVSTDSLTVDEGSPFTIEFSAFDPGDDTIHLWEVNWGDEDVWEPFAGNVNSATHVYQDNGQYKVQVRATNEDGVSESASLLFDSAFADGGSNSIDFFGASDIAYDLVEAPDGKIIVAGSGYQPELTLPGGFEFTFDGEPTYTTDIRQNFAGSEYFAVDREASYRLSAVATSDSPDVQHFFGFAAYDIDQNFINNEMFLRFGSAVDTRLAADLNPGDTQIVLEDTTGWYNGSNWKYRHFAWYGYSDSTGYAYQDYTYTRNYISDLWDEGAINGNVITLRSVWSGEAISAGTAVRNTRSGGTYNYALGYRAVAASGSNLSAVIGGGRPEESAIGFRPGTAFIRPFVLGNYSLGSGGGGNTLTVSDFRIDPIVENQSNNFALARFNPDGSLDATFGESGRISTDVGQSGSSDHAHSVVLQDDGKVLVAGRAYVAGQGNLLAIVRYDSHGGLDTSFGDDGVVQTTLRVSSTTGRLIELSGDRILVAGSSGSNFSVAAFDLNGSLDTNFGTSGIASFSFGSGNSYATSLALQSDGSIVVGGFVYGDTYDFAAVRFTAEGELDSGFGADGSITFDVDGGHDYAYEVLVGTADQLYLTGYGYSNSSNSHDFMVLALTADGQVNDGYGQLGVARFDLGGQDYSYSARILEDSSIVLTLRSYQSGSYQPMLVKLTPQGQLDAGTVIFPSEQQLDLYASSLSADGKLLLAGRQTGGQQGSDFFIASLSADSRVTVNNVAPVASYSHAYNYNHNNDFVEGETINFWGTFVDPSGSDTYTAWFYPDGLTGESTEISTYTYSSGGQTRITVSHYGSYVPDDDGLHQPVIRLVDDDGGFADLVFDLNVQDVLPPIIVAATDNSVDEGSPFTIEFSAYDPGDDTIHLWEVNWGDEDVWEPFAGNVSSATHVYQDNGQYTIQVRGTNEDGVAPVAVLAFDSSFGDVGQVVLPPISGENQSASVSLEQPDGKLLVAGQRYNSNSSNDFWISRFHADGTLDTGFGQAGHVLTDFGGYETINSIALKPQTNGSFRIVVAGTSSGRVALAAYESNGTPVASFGNNGKVLSDLPGGSESVRDLAILPEGSLVVAGYRYSSNDHNYDFLLAKFDTNGTLDTSFGNSGYVLTDFAGGSGSSDIASSVLVAGDKLIVTGYSSRNGGYDFALARYNANGTLDTSFGTDGKLTTDLAGSSDYPVAAVLQADGKIVLGGYAYLADNPGLGYDFALVRYNADGTLDTGFGDNGKVLVDVAETNNYARSFAQQADGKLVLAGSYYADNVNHTVMLRFNTDGTPDLSFGNGGQLPVNFAAGSNHNVVDIVATHDQRLTVLANQYISGQGNQITLHKLLPSSTITVVETEAQKKLRLVVDEVFYVQPGDQFNTTIGISYENGNINYVTLIPAIGSPAEVATVIDLVSSTATITWAVPTEPGGYRITLDAVDSTNPEIVERISFRVVAGVANQAPILDEPLSPVTAQVGQPLQIKPLVSDDGPDYLLSWSLGPNAPTGASIGSASGLLTWTPDGTDAGRQFDFNILVTDDGQPNQTTTIPVSIFVESQPPSISLDYVNTPSLFNDTLISFSDAGYPISVIDSTGSDPDLLLSVVSDFGEIRVTDSAGVALAEGGWNQFTNTIVAVGSASELTNLLSTLTFKPGANHVGTAELKLEVSINGGTQNPNEIVMPVEVRSSSEAKLHVRGFGLAADQQHTFEASIVTPDVPVDRLVVQLDWDGSERIEHPDGTTETVYNIDQSVEVIGEFDGVVEFSVDASQFAGFSTALGLSSIGYRVVALDSNGNSITRDVFSEETQSLVPIDVQSPWHRHDYELTLADDQGDIRVDDIRLYFDSGSVDQGLVNFQDLTGGDDAIDQLVTQNPGSVNPSVDGGQAPPAVVEPNPQVGISGASRVYDPRIYGKINGDFDGNTVRIVFVHQRDGIDFQGEVTLTENGEFLYDPREIDAGLTEITANTDLEIDYSVFVLQPDPNNPAVLLESPLLDGQGNDVSDIIAFTLKPVGTLDDPDFITYLSATAVVDQDSGFTTPGWIVSGSVDYPASGSGGAYYIEFDFPESNGTFDGLADDTVVAEIVNEDGGVSLYRFENRITQTVGTWESVRVRGRQYDQSKGEFVYGSWIDVELPELEGLAIGPLFADSPSSLREKPLVSGWLEGAPEQTGDASQIQEDYSRLANIRIEFYHGHTVAAVQAGGIQADGVAFTDAFGHFEYSVEVSGYQSTSIVARTAIEQTNGNVIYGAAKYTTVRRTHPALPSFQAGEDGFRLVELTESTDDEYGYYYGEDPKSASPQFAGTIIGSQNENGVDVDQVFIQFAVDRDDTSGDEFAIVGTAIPDSDGYFEYFPIVQTTAPDDPGSNDEAPVIFFGTQTVRARVAWLDPLNDQVYSNNVWRTVRVEVIEATNDPATVVLTSVAGADDQNIPHTQTPIVSGQVTNPDGFVDGVTVELRFAGSTETIGTTTTDSEGNFSYTFVNLAAGTVRVEARAIDWDYHTRQQAEGPWSDVFEFVLDAQEPAIISEFALLSDTGASQSDAVTANATLVGTVSGPNVYDIEIAFNRVGSDVIEATTRTDAAGQFIYRPQGLAEGIWNYRARIATLDEATGQYSYSADITSGAFTLQAPTGSAAKIVSVDLENRQAEVKDSTIVGKVVSEGSLEQVVLEFDLDSDGSVDTTASANVYGEFSLTPVLQPGLVNVQVRTRTLDRSGLNVLLGEFQSIAQFNYQPDAVGPSISLLEYEYGEVRGYVSDQQERANVTIEFSNSANGPVVGSTALEDFGYDFRFVPGNLTPGDTYTIHARAKEIVDGQDIYGLSESITFVAQADVNPLPIVDLRLTNDTSASGGTNDDGVTSDAAIEGRLNLDASNDLTVYEAQFDLGSGPWQQVALAADGSFRLDGYTPSDIGYHSIRVRVQGNGVYGHWQRINFIFDTDDGSAPSIALAEALSILDPNWQTADEAFDRDLAREIADGIYDAANDNANSDADFANAVAAQQQKAQEAAANAAFRASERAAAEAYEAAVASARDALRDAIADLPESRQYSFDLDRFQWPEAPDVTTRSEVLNTDGIPQLQPFPESGFDPERDSRYQAERAQAQAQLANQVSEASNQYQQDVQASEDAYESAVDGHNDTYRQDVEAAQDKYRQKLEDAPEPDDTEEKSISDQLKEAYDKYRKAIDGNYESYRDIQQAAAKTRDDAVEDLREARSEELAEADWDDHDDINDRYADAFEAVLNTYSNAVIPAATALTIANAEDLRTLRSDTNSLYRDLAKSRIGNKVQRTNYVLDARLTLTTDLADATKKLKSGLASAAQEHDKGIADAAKVHDDAIIHATAQRDARLNQARVDVTRHFDAVVGSVWSAWQLANAENQYHYQVEVIELAKQRDLAKSAAKRDRSHREADAVAAKESGLAGAQRNRTVDLAIESTKHRKQSGVEYQKYEKQAADRMFEFRETMADADRAKIVDAANAREPFSIASAELGNHVSSHSWWYYSYSEIDWDAVKRESAAISRDSAHALIPIYEQFTGEAIDANKELQKSRTGDYHRMYRALTDLRKTYEIEVARAQDRYNVAQAGISANFTIGNEKAQSGWTLDNLYADAAYEFNIAPLDANLHVENIRAKTDADIGQASELLVRLQNWAGSNISAAQQQQLDKAANQINYLIAVQQAELVHAVRVQTATRDYRQALAVEENSEAISLYDVNTGAYVTRVKTIADAQISIAESNSVADNVTKLAGAKATHDKALGDANRDFQNKWADVVAARSREVSRASYQLQRDNADLAYDRAIESLNDDPNFESINQRQTDANNKHRDAVAAADKTRSIDIATARKDWTYRASEAHTAYVKNIAGAQTDRADQIANQIITLANATADAEETYGRAVADSARRLSNEAANGVHAVSEAEAYARETHNIALAAAVAGLTYANNQAFLNYQINAANESLASANSRETFGVTAQTGYDVDVATARIQLTSATFAPESTYMSQYVSQQVDLATDEAAAQREYALEAAYLQRDHQRSLAAENQTAQYEIVAARSVLHRKVESARAALERARTGNQVDLDGKIAEAAEKRNKAVADAGLEYVEKVAEAERRRTVEDDFGWNEYNNVQTQASDTREDKVNQANDTYQEAIDNFQIDEQADLGKARIKYVDDTTAAQVEAVYRQTNALSDEAAAVAELKKGRASDVAVATRTMEQQIATAVAGFNRAIAGLEVDLQAANVDAGIDYEVALARAEADYHVAKANARAVSLALAAAESPQDVELRFEAARSKAYAAWLVGAGDAFVAWRQTLAQANATSDGQNVAAQAGFEHARAIAQQRHEQSVAGWKSTRDTQIAIANADRTLLQVTDENTLQQKISDHQRVFAQAKTKAEVDYDAAIMRAQAAYDHATDDRDEFDPDYGAAYEALQQAKREAAYRRDKAIALAEFDYNQDVADLEHGFAVSAANGDLKQSNRLADAHQHYAEAIARSQYDQDLTIAGANNSLQQQYRNSGDQWQDQYLVAEVDFEQAQYNQWASAATVLANHLFVPQVTVHGIRGGYTNNDLQFIANQWNNIHNVGEFQISGTAFTEYDGSVVAIGNLGQGVAVQEDASGRGYLMYSQQDVFQRFAANPPFTQNANHLIAVKYDAGQWFYNNNLAWVSFTPEVSDQLLAEIDFDGDRVERLGGTLDWGASLQATANADANAFAAWAPDHLARRRALEAARPNHQSLWHQEALDRLWRTREHALTVAGEIGTAARDTATVQHTFAITFANIVGGQRRDVATADKKQADAIAQARLNQETDFWPIDQQHTAEVDQANELYGQRSRQLDLQRDTLVAQIGARLETNTAQSLRDNRLSEAQQELDRINQTEDDYLGAGGNGGWLAALHQADRDDRVTFSQAKAAQYGSIDAGGSAHTSFAKAEGLAHDQHYEQPVAEAQRVRDQQIDLSYRTLTLSRAQTDFTRESRLAQNDFANASLQAVRQIAAITAGGGQSANAPGSFGTPNVDTGNVGRLSTNLRSASVNPFLIDGHYGLFGRGGYNWYGYLGNYRGWGWGWGGYDVYGGHFGGGYYGGGYYSGYYHGGYGYHYTGFGFGGYGFGGTAGSYLSSPSVPGTTTPVDVRQQIDNLAETADSSFEKSFEHVVKALQSVANQIVQEGTAWWTLLIGPATANALANAVIASNPEVDSDADEDYGKQIGIDEALRDDPVFRAFRAAGGTIEVGRHLFENVDTKHRATELKSAFSFTDGNERVEKPDRIILDHQYGADNLEEAIKWVKVGLRELSQNHLSDLHKNLVEHGKDFWLSTAVNDFHIIQGKDRIYVHAYSRAALFSSGEHLIERSFVVPYSEFNGIRSDTKAFVLLNLRKDALKDYIQGTVEQAEINVVVAATVFSIVNPYDEGVLLAAAAQRGFRLVSVSITNGVTKWKIYREGAGGTLSEVAQEEAELVFKELADVASASRMVKTPFPWGSVDHAIPDSRLVDRAMELRQREGLMNAAGMRRNVAVAKVRIDGKEEFIERLNVGKGGPHSEELVAAHVKELRDAGKQVEVLELFTERIPCTNSGGCRSMIAEHMPGVNIFAFTRRNGPAAIRDLMDIYGL